jgi:predicted N-formylglutamate amidohydrolase
MRKPVLLLSCEHATDAVPLRYKTYFEGQEPLVHSHCGVDLGALSLATYLATTLSCVLIRAKATRLLIDCNRRLTNNHCFSEITAKLPLVEKKLIIQKFYLPFRNAVETQVTNYIKQGYQVWHFSIHTFTPVFKGQVRNADIGFLYDPARGGEKELARAWRVKLKHHSPTLRVRMNYPYRGITDGFTSFLRTGFKENEYLGLEIECNQALTIHRESLSFLGQLFALTLKQLLERVLD